MGDTEETQAINEAIELKVMGRVGDYAPDYCSSLDAVAEAEGKVRAMGLWHDYGRALKDLVLGNADLLVMSTEQFLAGAAATAEQRSRAILSAVKQARESEKEWPGDSSTTQSS